MSSVKAVEIRNTSDTPVTLSTESGLVTIPVHGSVHNVRLDERVLIEHASKVKARIQLHD
jgi:hypothetical protein